jgi:LytS/YehU family sensor histidine kinase
MQPSTANNEFNGPEKILMINISPAFWNTLPFRIIAAIFVLGIFYLVIRYRTRQRFKLQLERSGKEKQIAEIKQKASELEMQALRAQMNPHFIFNSLNSINRFILQNNKAEASEYLIKFSKLVRMILQNSQASLISLESELESLGLYLEMEALRFNYHFDYKISVSKDLDVEVLKVPPLIIQPYVENAIWHGLMQKEEKGQLDIEVWQEGDWVYLKITDNGIGRERASELASKSATRHKSMGLRITASRIAMMQHSNGEESPVKIHDLIEPDGAAAGTEVVIKMPLLYD